MNNKVYVIHMYGSIFSICSSMEKAVQAQSEMNSAEYLVKYFLEDNPNASQIEIDEYLEEEGAYITIVRLNEECDL